MSKKGGGGGSPLYEYFGSIAGVLCTGPVDTLEEIIMDGKTIWSGPLARGGNHVSTLSISGYGSLRFYWGTESHPADALLSSAIHPRYKGLCFFVLSNFLFGLERTSAPNIEFVITRKANTTLIRSGETSLNVTDDNVNPVAAIAEMIEDKRWGLDQGEDFIDRASLRITASTYESESKLFYIAPHWTNQRELRGVLKDIALVARTWVRYNPNIGGLEVGRWIRGEDVVPGNLPVISSKHLTEPPEFSVRGWDEVNTSFQMKFKDRKRSFKDNSVTVHDLRAASIRDEPQNEFLTREMVTRYEQAENLLREEVKLNSAPGLDKGKISVRRAMWRSLDLKPGDYALIDLDPEPDATEIRFVCRITDVTLPFTGPVRVQFEREFAQEAIVVEQNDLGDVSPGELEPEPIAENESQIFPLPPVLANGALGAVAALAQRQDSLSSGFELLYNPTDAGEPFESLGSQSNFAALGTTGGTFSATATSFTVDLAGNLEIDWLLNFSSDARARNREVLAFIIKDTDPGNYLEIMNVTAIAPTATQDEYTVTVERGHFGTIPVAWAESGDIQIWFLRRTSIVPFFHADFPGYYGSSDNPWFKFLPFNAYVRLDEGATGVVTYDKTKFPGQNLWSPIITVDGPTSNPYSAGDQPQTVRVHGTVTDEDANLVALSMIRRDPDGTETVIWQTPLSMVKNAVFDQTITFSAAGTFDVIIRAQDSTGIVSEESIEIQLSETGTTQVARPVFTPGAGDYTSAPTVAITTATTGATIYYKITDTDAAEPTAWDTYSGSFSMPLAKKLWSYATKSGLTDSDIRTGIYFPKPYGGGGGYWQEP